MSFSKRVSRFWLAKKQKAQVAPVPFLNFNLRRCYWSGALEEVAAPVGSLRITPDWSVKKPRCPEVPCETGVATMEYPVEGTLPSPVNLNVYPLLVPPARTLSTKSELAEVAAPLVPRVLRFGG